MDAHSLDDGFILIQTHRGASSPQGAAVLLLDTEKALCALTEWSPEGTKPTTQASKHLS